MSDFVTDGEVAGAITMVVVAVFGVYAVARLARAYVDSRETPEGLLGS
ncbi:hypothetical protein [Adlercreutzia agrestimuris]|nr:hypothetical protein [Adlercreutzia agrestimuris]